MECEYREMFVVHRFAQVHLQKNTGRYAECPSRNQSNRIPIPRIVPVQATAPDQQAQMSNGKIVATVEDPEASEALEGSLEGEHGPQHGSVAVQAVHFEQNLLDWEPTHCVVEKNIEQAAQMIGLGQSGSSPCMIHPLFVEMPILQIYEYQQVYVEDQ